MNYLVVLIVDDPDNCSDLLNAWEQAGVKGVTILESTGLGHVKRKSLREDLSMMPSLSEILGSEEERHRTIFSVVESQELVDELVRCSQKILGNLDEPDTGFMFVLPVLQAFGLNHKGNHKGEGG